jgi:L-fuculose-phosphate aldolase
MVNVKASYQMTIRAGEFFTVGSDLAASGAVTTHGGNLSMSNGKLIYITKTGSQLGHLDASDIIVVDWEASAADETASMELLVHRAMYHAQAQRLIEQGEAFDEAAIVHAHALHTVFHSLQGESIQPVDSEGIFVLGDKIQVFSPEKTIASDQVETLMANAVLAGEKIAVIRGHGAFAIADTLAGAHRLVSCLEYSAQLLTLMQGK